MRLKLLICIFPLFFISKLNAQDGFIRGSVFEAATGETLTGVTIVIEGTTIGTSTDLDGKFNLRTLPGTYDLRISFISFETVNLKSIKVAAGEVTLLNDISLKEATVELNEVIVTANVVRNTETALLALKRKSPNLMDGISASNLKKIGDSDAASSMKRVPGVSVTGGKYVYVRGLGDRYTKTILNGVDIPGLDPDRNTLQMDIFPTNIIDNIIVHKSFSADLPADFTGGIINIETQEFPESKKGKISVSLGYNPSSHFNSNYLTYEGGSTDFLGFDDGTREIPATDNIPQYVQTITDPEAKSRYKEILNGFNPNMAAMKQSSLMDFGLGFSFGNQLPREKVTLGYNFAFSYKNNTDFFESAEDGKYAFNDSKDVFKYDRHEYQIGSYGVNSVLVSGLAGFAIKTNSSKYRINLLHLQNGESKAGIYDFYGSDDGSNFTAYQHTLDYSQRSLTNLLISGKHAFRSSNWEIEWKVSPTISKLYDPDIRFTRYRIEDDGRFTIGTEVGFPERIWRELEEINIGGLVNVTKEFNFQGRKSKFLFGGAYTYKERDYIIRNFALNIRGPVPTTGDPDELLLPENQWPFNSNEAFGTTFETPFIPNNPNEFNANSINAAGYVSTELSVTRNLKTIIGIRVESFTQRYTGADQGRKNVLTNDIVLDDIEIFPSANFIYSLNEKQNVRFSYTKTIARPSFKELSYAEIYDPISGSTFIGTFHQDGKISDDGNPANDTIYWDGNLVSTDIHNFDIRWELFQTNAQTISVSGFYKKFYNPIEIVQYTIQTGSYQPRNVGNGEVIGAELEVRQNLDFITLDNFSFISNFTINKSRIKMGIDERESRISTARIGQKIDKYRNMAGQAPYLMNGGISYNGGDNGFWKGFEAGLYYNVQGLTLEYVGIAELPDIYTKPFHSLNFNSNKKLGENERIQIGLKISNILNSKKESIYKTDKIAEQYYKRRDPGVSFKASFSYSFF